MMANRAAVVFADAADPGTAYCPRLTACDIRAQRVAQPSELDLCSCFTTEYKHYK
jgi:hypothetical protein